MPRAGDSRQLLWRWMVPWSVLSPRHLGLNCLCREWGGDPLCRTQLWQRLHTDQSLDFLESFQLEVRAGWVEMACVAEAAGRWGLKGRSGPPRTVLGRGDRGVGLSGEGMNS